MILSFNPVIVADLNRIVAGRESDSDDLAAIRRADAVILSQGCSAALYRLAAENTPNVFPDFRARFDYPGKTGQARLFRQTDVKHPRTLVFDTVEQAPSPPPMDTPFVFKMNWGGEGDAVFLISDRRAYDEVLAAAARLEQSGNRGFVVQEYIPSGKRSIRVVVIGTRCISYWRESPNDGNFKASLAAGGTIDRCSAPLQLAAAESAVTTFCGKTGINLAGFDLLFAEQETNLEPYFIEINYFFGRRGLGGSERYYRLLNDAVCVWLASKGLSIDHD